MIALFLLLAAQAAAPAPDAPPAQTPPSAPRVCRKAAGSDTIVCGPAPQQQLGYRLPKYGPAAPGAQSNRGKTVKVGARTTNRGPARRNRSMATVGIPF
jgi:hypothetical protein